MSHVRGPQALSRLRRRPWSAQAVSALPLAPLAESASRGKRRRRNCSAPSTSGVRDGKLLRGLDSPSDFELRSSVACDQAALGCPGTARPLSLSPASLQRPVRCVVERTKRGLLRGVDAQYHSSTSAGNLGVIHSVLVVFKRRYRESDVLAQIAHLGK